MSNFTLNTKIILRNDTKANWASVNPVLSKGEAGIEVDTGKIKIGDGVKAWAELGYANVLPSELDTLNYGDMHKAVYDTNNDGKVDSADLADRALLADNATMAEEAKVAGKLKTPVTIAGVAFDGSANIDLTKANIGLANVDNTSDLDKPISTATQGALDAIKGRAGVGVDLGTVDAKADANATEITAVKERVSTAEGKVTALETLTTAQGEKLTAVEAKATANAGEITTLKGRADAVEGDVSTLKTKMTGAESRLGAVEPKVTALETKVDVAKVSTAISDAITASEAKLGTSATKNVGTAVGNVVEVQADGKIASSIIPSIAITDTFVVDSESAMLALSKAEKGDVAIRTDVKKSYILAENGYNVLENWKLLETPADAVSSVNGQTGVVNLTTSDIAEGSNLYYTDERVSAHFRTQSSASLTDGATLLHSTDVLILNGGNA